jgi:predicted enzyme related to lactoylglutathione lyase
VGSHVIETEVVTLEAGLRGLPLPGAHETHVHRDEVAGSRDETAQQNSAIDVEPRPRLAFELTLERCGSGERSRRERDDTIDTIENSETDVSTHRFGHFVWHELWTPDAAAAEQFYGALLGWTFEHTDMGDMGMYRVGSAEGKQQGGIMQIPEGEAMPAAWSGYVSVPDVDAATKAAVDAGASVMVGPMDIPGVGRVATLTDPEGAVFNVFRDHAGDGPPREMPALGEFCWDSLAVADGEAALAFYGKVVGWTRGKFGDAPGIFFGVPGSDLVVADVDAPAPGAPASWTAHVVVASLADARAKVESLGAKVLVPTIQVPNVGTMAIIADPWGAVLSLFEPAMPA